MQIIDIDIDIAWPFNINFVRELHSVAFKVLDCAMPSNKLITTLSVGKSTKCISRQEYVSIPLIHLGILSVDQTFVSLVTQPLGF